MYVQSNTFWLADVFEKFQNMCLEIYKLDPAHFLTALGLALQAALKKAKVKLDLLTNTLLEKCPDLEFLWCVFFRIWTE